MTVKYENGKVYKIYSPSTGLTYVGATTQQLCKRLGKHKSNYNDWKNGLNTGSFMTSFILIEIGDAEIELLESVKAQNKDELNARERYYIRTIECINQTGKNGSNNSEKVVQKYLDLLDDDFLEHFLKHKQEISKHKKNYYENNKEKMLEKIKEYYQNNKAQISERQKKYREANKERITEKQKETIECSVCKVEITRHHFRRHERSLTHKLNLVKQNPELIIDENANKKHCSVCDVFIGKDDFNRHEKTKKHIKNLANKQETE